MFPETNSDRFSRRAFLRNVAVGAAGLTLAASVKADDKKSPYAPFRMGIQSYSLRAFKAEDALKMTKELGLNYWESFEAHLPITDDPKKIDEYKAMLKAYDVKLVAFGVVSFNNNEADARKKFQFAKAMGLETLSAYPTYDALPLLDKLVAEYKINIGIHNHGPGDDLYDRIQKGTTALEGHHPRVGMCIDTGHYIRSDEDPVEAARKFGKRVFGIHLKDVKVKPDGGKEFTEIGKGKLDTVALLKVLKTNKFPGIVSLEYEEHEKEPMPYIQECLAATREAVKKMKA
jgi:inosose dehydratase